MTLLVEHDYHWSSVSMSFMKAFNFERQQLGPLFIVACEADKRFHEAWDQGVAEHGHSRYKETEQYNRTLKDFNTARQAIDRIVSNAYGQALRGGYDQLAILFAYIDLPGRYFRSGYSRGDIWHMLKRLPLDEEQCAILREIILGQIELAGPEFKQIAKVAPRVSTPEFCERIQSLCLSNKKWVSIRAKRILELLESSAL